MSSPSVSVLVPIYNVERYIERCVESLGAQSFRDFEVIFVDDCSPDNSVRLLGQLLENYPWMRVKLIRHKENMGVAAARITALHAAKGTYVIHVDSDDYVHPDYLSTLYDAAVRDDADIVVCDFFYDVSGILTPREQPVSKQPKVLVSQLLAGEVHNALWNKLVRRNLIVEHELYQIPGLNMMEDKSVMFRIAYFASRIVHVNEPLYYYVWSNQTSLTKSHKSKHIPQAMMLIDVIDDFFSKNKADTNILYGISVCKASIAAMILMHGSKNQRKDFLPRLKDYHLIDALKASTLPIHYKLFNVSHKLHLGLLASLLRALYSLTVSKRGI